MRSVIRLSHPLGKASNADQVDAAKAPCIQVEKVQELGFNHH